MIYKKQPSIASRAMTAAHIIHRAGLGFTFSRCLVQAYAALKTKTAASFIHSWLLGCLNRATATLKRAVSIEAYWAMRDKIGSVWGLLFSI